MNSVVTNLRRAATLAYRAIKPVPMGRAITPASTGWEQLLCEIVASIRASERLSTLASRLNHLEDFLTENPPFAQTAHRDIGKALFERSPALYAGDGLPEHLRRYTYPAFLSVALSTHCNAACFFCRESDYKGTSIDFTDLAKLETPIRYADRQPRNLAAWCVRAHLRSPDALQK
jgi:hypothetical protein